MTPALLVSSRVVREYRNRLSSILAAAPRNIELLEFEGTLAPAPDLARIEAAFYSRDIWFGTINNVLNEASQRFWTLVDAAPHVKWIQLVSAGADQLHYQRAHARGVRLTTASGTNAEPVAVTAVTGLLMLARNFPEWTRAQHAREWAPQPPSAHPPDLSEQVALIVGTGHIGAIIARVLKALGVRTIGVKRKPRPLASFDEVHPIAALDALLPQCDWLVLACPLTPETRGLIDRRRLALLGSHAGLVNVSRGEVVDEPALIDALASNRLKGAYLDVFSVEPLPASSPLWTLPNVVITPHDSTASSGNYGRGVELFLRNLEAYLAGRELENEVA